ncbi:MAG: type IIL restriction-modification enzyme MmeI, partial [Archangium sp.]
ATQGNKPWDDGGLIVEAEDYAEVAADPRAARYLRPLRGARELLHNLERWCLWLVDADPEELRRSPILSKRLQHVREFRARSKTGPVREKAAVPSLFSEVRQPNQRFLAMPQTSSENRPYIPAVFYDASVIVTNGVFMWPGADFYLFGMLQSAMFTAWVAAVSGRLKSDFQIAPGTVYNTFPFPTLDESQRGKIAEAAQAVRNTRANYPGSSLATLYESAAMPPALAEAHRALDKAVDAAMGLRGRSAPTEAERLQVLFTRYQGLASPVGAEVARAKKPARRGNKPM